MGRNSLRPKSRSYSVNAATCADFMSSNHITLFFFETGGSSDNSGETMSEFPVLGMSQIPKASHTIEFTMVGNETK